MRARQTRPRRVAETLQRLLQRIDPDRRLRVYEVWTFWEEEVGETIAARAEPAGFRRGVLSVRVNGHAWMQELQFMKETIREKLNARLGAELIRDIYFVSGSVTARVSVDASPSGGDALRRGPRLAANQRPATRRGIRPLGRAQARAASRRRDAKDDA